MEYKTAIEKLQSARDPRAGKPIGNNTRLVRDGDAIAVRLHETNVVTFHSDGSVTLNSGGWRTVTTKARINEYAPVHVHSECGTWYVNTGIAWKGGHVFQDGIRVYQDGSVTGAGKESDVQAEARLRRAIAAYAKAYVEKLYNRELETPSAGDCWGCSMATSEGKHPLGGRDHIKEHVREKYYVPSLVVNAVNERGSQVAKHDVAVLLKFGGATGDERLCCDGRADSFARNEIRRAIVKLCKREVGIA